MLTTNRGGRGRPNDLEGFAQSFCTPPSTPSNSRSPSISPSMSASSPGAVGVLRHKQMKHASSYRTSDLTGLGKPTETESTRSPRKGVTVKRYIPREDSLELKDVFLEPKGKNFRREESESTEGTLPDSWNGSSGSFSTYPLSSPGGRWVASNDSMADMGESQHSRTSSRSISSSGDATTCAGNLSALKRARRKIMSKANTTCMADDEFSETCHEPIATTEDIDEFDLMEYACTGPGANSTSRVESTLKHMLAMHSRTSDAAVKLTKDVDAFVTTVQAAVSNRKIVSPGRCLSDTNLVSRYQVKQQEIERLHKVTAERQKEAVRYKQMSDEFHSPTSGRASPKPNRISRRGSTSAIISAGDEAGKRRSQLIRSGRGTKDLSSMLTSQTTGSILKQKHQRRYSTGTPSSGGTGLAESTCSASQSFHDSASSFLSQDTTSGRSTFNFSVKFKKPTIITYEKEQDHRTHYDSGGRRRSPSKPYAAGAADLNNGVENEVVARRLTSATTGTCRRNAARRDSMPAGHMGESSPIGSLMPSAKTMARRSTTDMIATMEQRLRRLSNESSDDTPSQDRPSRRVRGDAVNSFYQCPEENAIDATMYGVGKRGAAATLTFVEESRSCPRSPRVVTRPPSKIELAIKAMGFGSKGG